MIHAGAENLVVVSILPELLGIVAIPQRLLPVGEAA
jgi:hypothetical protein